MSDEVADGYGKMAFADWVRGWFDHPDDWDWMRDGDLPYLSPVQTIAYATRLFETAGETLAPYPDHQIGQGLWALVNGIDSPLYALRDEGMPEENRVRCLSSVSGVYEQVFAPRCEELIGNEKMPKLNLTCFLWWEIHPSPWYSSALTDDEKAATLAVMERALALPNAACQESAIHGLGHWCAEYGGRAVAILDAFLASGTARRVELVGYAELAREGRVQ